MRAKKLTDKQEKFCQLAIELGEKAEAYRGAYNAENMSARVSSIKAYELAKLPHITARIDELREGARMRNSITVDSLLAELEESRQAALCADTPQASAAIAATMGKAKLLGLDKQIINHVGATEATQTPTVIELVGCLSLNSLSDAAMAEILNARDAAIS